MTEEQYQTIALLCLQISAAGKYHAFFSYSGHVNTIDISIMHANTDYKQHGYERLCDMTCRCHETESWDGQTVDQMIATLRSYLIATHATIKEAS